MINASWIFVLDSEPLGEVKLNFAPEGWEEQAVSLKRSPLYKGLRRSISTSLRFVGDGKDYIQQIRESNGTETEVKIAIYEYSPKPVDKYLLFYSGIVDISTYNSDEDIFVECDINDGSFSTKLMARDSVKVDLNSIISIDGLALDPINEVTVQLHQRELLNTATYVLDELTATVTSETSAISGSPAQEGFSLPMLITASNVSNALTPSAPQPDAIGSNFWGPSENTSILTITGTIKGTMGIAPTQTGNEEIRILFRVYTDDTLQTIDYDTAPLQTFNITDPTKAEAIDITIDTEFQNITTDQTIALIAIADLGLPFAEAFSAEFTEINVNIAQNIQWKDGTPAQGYLIFDAFEKITEVITDTKGTFKSAYFGPGGEGELETIHSGKQIRQFSNEYVSESFENLFKSMDAQHNIGIGIEYDNIGQPYIRCEKEEYFYSGDVVLTIHNVSEFGKDTARNRMYNEIEVGYVKAEYEEVNGLEEYNNKFEWTTFIKTVKNKLSLISPIRGDGYGRAFAQRKPFDQYPTEDTKYDNDNFNIIVLPDGVNYQSARLENYDFVENIFSPETATNLDITPGRMLRAHGGKIRSGLKHYLNEPLRFQFAQQLSDLKSQRTGEGPITENENIDVNTLEAPRWIPDNYKFKSVLTREQLAVLSRNPNGIVKFSAASAGETTNYFYGWLEDINNEADKDTAIWELLRVDTTSSSVTLVDPEGDSPDVPVPPVEPSEIRGTLEGSFPFVFAGPSPTPEGNAYNFSNLEKITIPGIPDFESTSTFYIKALVENKATGNDINYILQNEAASPTFRGLWVRFGTSDRPFNENKLIIDLISDNSTANKISIKSTNEVILPDVKSNIEIWYIGNSIANGITANVNGAPIAFTVIDDNLTGSTLTGSNGFVIGQPKNFNEDSTYILDNLSFTVDGTLKFDTECDNNGDLICVNLNGDSGNGTIDLNETPREDFFITV